MAVLRVPRPLISEANPSEEQFDLMRIYLLNFFNGRNLGEDNLANGGFSYTELGQLVDDAQLKFVNTHAYMVFDSASNKFIICNILGTIAFGHRASNVLTEYVKFRSDGHAEMFLPNINANVGATTVPLMWLLSRYRKPRLEYFDADAVSIEENGIVESQTLIMMRDRLCTVIDRTCSLAVSANGVSSSDSGAAVSGRAVGVSRTDNRWYFIYAVEVQGGTNADGTNAILVAHTTAPLRTNISSINSAFGEGKWVYVGCIRNGYNDGSNDGVIPRFIYDENGYCMFTHTASTNESRGITLASGQSTENLEYAIVIGNDAAATLPIIATRVVFTGHREINGFEMHYRSISTDENHMIRTACTHNNALSTLTSLVQMEVPLLENYKVVIVIGNVDSERRIALAGFQDHFA